MEVLFAYYHGARSFTAHGAATFRLGFAYIPTFAFYYASFQSHK